MGIFKKGKVIVITFLSNRTNLTLCQCILYGFIGYVMGQYLAWPKLLLMFGVLILMQHITRIKSVADGMMYREMMVHHDMKANEIIELMRKTKEDLDKDKDQWN
tara:strand:+ start:162 stop:473 length:312 start_codon:yes stop_codon:yes gene_type:complete